MRFFSITLCLLFIMLLNSCLSERNNHDIIGKWKPVKLDTDYSLKADSLSFFEFTVDSFFLHQRHLKVSGMYELENDTLCIFGKFPGSINPKCTVSFSHNTLVLEWENIGILKTYFVKAD